jgi:hypothetical protein
MLASSSRDAPVAQLAAHRSYEPTVAGSRPAWSRSFLPGQALRITKVAVFHRVGCLRFEIGLGSAFGDNDAAFLLAKKRVVTMGLEPMTNGLLDQRSTN